MCVIFIQKLTLRFFKLNSFVEGKKKDQFAFQHLPLLQILCCSLVIGNVNGLVFFF